jgi:hypothetical protein
MRFVRPLLAAATSAAALVQDAGAKIGAWYTQPVWTAIGVIVLVLVIVLISMAERRTNKTGVK